MDDTVKFRHGYADGHLHGIHAFRRLSPFLLRHEQGIALQYRDSHFMDGFPGNGTGSGEGEFHHIHQTINHRLSILHEIAVKHLIQRGHAQLRIRKTVGKDRNHIKPLPFGLFNEGILVFRIAPYPFIPVKEEPNRRAARNAVPFPVSVQIRHIPVLHTLMIQSCPTERRRPRRLSC